MKVIDIVTYRKDGSIEFKMRDGQVRSVRPIHAADMGAFTWTPDLPTVVIANLLLELSERITALEATLKAAGIPAVERTDTQEA